MLGIDVIAAITVRLIDRPIDDLGGESAVHIRLDPYAIGAIVDGIDVAVFAHVRQQRTGVVGQQRRHVHARNGQHRFDAPQQVVKTLSRGGGQKIDDESIRDTLIDLANYAIMTVLEMEVAKDVAD